MTYKLWLVVGSQLTFLFSLKSGEERHFRWPLEAHFCHSFAATGELAQWS